MNKIKLNKNNKKLNTNKMKLNINKHKYVLSIKVLTESVLNVLFVKLK